MHQTRILAVSFFLVLIFLPQIVSAKSEWIQVRSKSFNLIGDASEKDIRKVATKLEQFRATFRLLFVNTAHDASIPTNVVVFKNDRSYENFKPKRADGKIDKFIAGYFQPGEDVNYITLSMSGEDDSTYGTIFHEYVHFIIETNFGKSDVPSWFNEGLAEYYQTFAIENDQKVKLGIFQQNHLYLLQQNKLIPLRELFGVGNYSLQQTGNHSRSIFYAQSWALVHYLMQTEKSAALGKFLDLSIKGPPSEKNFQDTFQMNYAQMEDELKKYVKKSSYQYQIYELKEKLTFDSDMKVSPLSEAASDAYLGDLLYHTNRADDAEEFLQKSLALEPDSSMANTTYGMVKIRQRKFDEAKNFLDKALVKDQKNHLAFYNYAYLLSREGRDEFGYVTTFPPDKSEKMRGLLKKAIAVNPAFAESYELLAFINMVNNEQLGESVVMLKTALKYHPGNQKYLLRIAEIYARQQKFQEAETLAAKISASADNPQLKVRAENLTKQIVQMKENFAQRENSLKQFEESISNAEKSGAPVLIRQSEENLSPEEIAKIREHETLVSLNYAIKKTKNGEQQILGKIQKIECKNGAITYTVNAENKNIILSSKDFENLNLVAHEKESEAARVGCGEDLSAFNSVVTFNPADANNKTRVQGELVAIDFVPANFRFINLEEEKKRVAQIIEENRQNPPMPPPRAVNTEDMETRRRAAITEAIKKSMRQPQADEKRETGLLEKIECTGKGMFFLLKTPTQILKLSAASPQSIKMQAFTPEVEQVQFGCGLKQLDVKVIFTYKENSNGKSKSNGELIALEFVPKSFEL